MISYEVGLGLAVAAVLMYTGTMRMSEIVAAQEGFIRIGELPVFPRWLIVPQFPAFLIFGYAALAETNRPPFDMPEAEGELVAGYHTEYSGIRFAMFFLAEYLHLITISAVAVTLFLGGWRGPIFDFLPWLWPLLWFVLKVIGLLFLFIWIRATLPRIRYDRLMNFGWKVVIPVGLLWVLATGAIVILPDEIGRDALLRWVGIGAGVMLVLSLVMPLFTRSREKSR
jgi:NADH-quinone oxidoreductase subunit H